jgi:hypothetical protein
MGEDFTVEVLDSITGEEADRTWESYDASYHDYNRQTPIKQSMRKDDFYADLANSAFKKVTVRDSSGEIVGLGICTFDLEQLPWISAEFFKYTFPDDYGRILHLAGMYIKPDRRGVKASEPLMLGIRQLSRDNGGRLVGFDCSLKLQSWLPGVVMRATGGQPVGGAFENGELDRQVYFLLEDVEARQDEHSKQPDVAAE